jgi:HTH-type transcriptional regulator / antitoxin HipB
MSIVTRPTPGSYRYERAAFRPVQARCSVLDLEEPEIGTFVPVWHQPSYCDQRKAAIEISFAEQLAAEVRDRRGLLRLSQRDLAELAGVSERFVRFVEQGKRTVQLESLLALLDTLGLELRVQTRTSAAARTIDGSHAVGGGRAHREPHAPGGQGAQTGLHDRPEAGS